MITGLLNQIYGYRLIESDYFVEEICTKILKRKKKNRRWVKKWKKKYTKIVPQQNVIINRIQRTIYGHSIVIQKLKKEMK